MHGHGGPSTRCEIRLLQVPDVTMAYWDKGSKGTRNNGLPASLTDEFIKLDGEVGGGCPACMWRGACCPGALRFASSWCFPSWLRRPRRGARSKCTEQPHSGLRFSGEKKTLSSFYDQRWAGGDYSGWLPKDALNPPSMPPAATAQHHQFAVAVSGFVYVIFRSSVLLLGASAPNPCRRGGNTAVFVVYAAYICHKAAVKREPSTAIPKNGSAAQQSPAGG